MSVQLFLLFRPILYLLLLCQSQVFYRSLQLQFGGFPNGAVKIELLLLEETGSFAALGRRCLFLDIRLVILLALADPLTKHTVIDLFIHALEVFKYLFLA